MENSNEVLKYTTEEVDIASVCFVQSKFFGRQDIKTALAYQDKIDIFDGHILYKGEHKFNVQVKGSETNQNDSIDKKYILSAQTQDLIYFYCNNVFSDNKKLYYKIFNKKEIIENKKYLQMGQTISVGKCGFKEFEYSQFIKELDFFVEKNIHIIEVDVDVYNEKYIVKGQTKLTGTLNPNKFNELKVDSLKTIVKENGFLYSVVPKGDFDFTILPESSEIELDIDGEMIQCKRSVDAIGNYQFKFKYMTIDIIGYSKTKEKFKIDYNLKKANLLDYKEQMMALKFLKKIGCREFDETLKGVENFVRYSEDFVGWLKEENLYELVLKLDKLDIDKLFEDYQYFKYEYEKEQCFPFLKISENRYIACAKNKKQIMNLKNVNFSGYGDSNKRLIINYCFVLLLDIDDNMIEKLLSSININIEDVIITLLNGENLIDDEPLSNINSIREINGYSNFLLVLISVFIYSKNEQIYELLLSELLQYIDNDIYFINYIQLKKHAGKDIALEEYTRLEGILESNNNKQINLCCLILLNSYRQKDVFDSLSQDEKQVFKKYPIFKLKNFL